MKKFFSISFFFGTEWKNNFFPSLRDGWNNMKKRKCFYQDIKDNYYTKWNKWFFYCIKGDQKLGQIVQGYSIHWKKDNKVKNCSEFCLQWQKIYKSKKKERKRIFFPFFFLFAQKSWIKRIFLGLSIVINFMWRRRKIILSS